MNIQRSTFKLKALTAAIALVLPMTSSAAATIDELETELDTLRNQMSNLGAEVQQAAEWKNPNTLIHMAGYADVGMAKSDAPDDDGSFNIGSFSPIFHYQYRDVVVLESELEIEVGEDGATEVKLEYLSIDWFLNDNMVLVAGKFLSPIGQFRQNLHPSWINKLPSSPPGFGHDGASPVSDLGVQLRGGLHLGAMKANYAVYMGHGPEVKAEIELDPADDTVIEEIEFDGVDAEAFGADRDGEKVFGGRIGLLPIPNLEVAVSFLSGKAAVTEFEDGDPTSNGSAPSLDGIAASDYDVIGFDAVWQNKNMDLRYEFVETEMSSTSIGGFDLESAKWQTWYAQFAYKFLPSKYEVVVRYTDFDSPHASADLQQTAFGVNYTVTSNFIGKIAFESNDNPNNGLEADDRVLVQLAYGF